jgi:hypothetical protein
MRKEFPMKYSIKLLFAYAIMTMAGVTAAFSHGYTIGQLEIGHPYAFVMHADEETGIGFLNITNSGKNDDRLIGISSPSAQAIILQDVHHQEAPQGLIVPAGDVLTLQPGGGHIVFQHVHAPFKLGDHIPGTLHFQQAGDIEVEFKISLPGLGSATQQDHSH